MKTARILICILLHLLFLEPRAQESAALPAGKMLPVEKIFLHTDKNQYLAGEIMWFKAYLQEVSSHRMSTISKVGYVEILDGNNVPVLQAKIALDSGTGSGSLFIPVTLATGHYLVRGYTNWMKNRGAETFFHKQVSIINTYKPFTPEKKSVATFHLDLLPESGNLVNGLPARVGFRGTDSLGRGAIFSGFVVNELSDTLIRFRPLVHGIGRFSFTPDLAHQYRVIAQQGDNIVGTFSLPPIQAAGYVLRVQESANGVKIETHASPSQDPQLVLVVQSAGKEPVSREISLPGDHSSIEWERGQFSEGVNTITLFDRSGKPLAERLYFKLPSAPLPITVQATQQQFQTRSRVKVEIGTPDSDFANLSMAVYKSPSYFGSVQDNIYSWFWLHSDLRGIVEDPASYFVAGPTQQEALDNLMLTHGWRNINASKKDQKPLMRFLPEIQGHIVEGKLTSQVSGKPMAEIDTYLSIPGTITRLYTSTSDSAGLLRYVLPDYYGAGELIVQTDYRMDSTYKIEIRSPFFDRYAPIALPPFRLENPMEEDIRRGAWQVQVSNGFDADKLRRFYEQPMDTSSFYGKPDNIYLLDDYKRFTTMEEVLREYVPTVLVRRRDGSRQVEMVNNYKKEVFQQPLLLLDGLAVFSSEQLLRYDPLKVRKLELINNRYIYGASLFTGIASFTTYKGDLEGFTPDPRAVVLDYEGLQLQRQYYSPVYETEIQRTSRIPDYRTVLDWNPVIRTGKDGKSFLEFYTSDIPGNYILVVEGMGADGRVGSAQTAIRVEAARK